MQRRTKLWAAKSVMILAAIPVLIYAYEYGPDAGVAGVPGEAGTCNQNGCHTGSATNSGGGSISVNFPNGLTYAPGVKQHLVVMVDDSTKKRWGFELTARLASDSTAMAGTFSPTDNRTQLICDTQADLGIWLKEQNQNKACPASLPLEYIEHTLAGYNVNQPSPGKYEFDWNPPSTDVGPITIYVSGNAGQGNLTTSIGDHIYTATYTLTTGSSSPQPAISSAGVMNAASLAGPSLPNAAIALGSIFTINGNNLGPQTAAQSGLPLQTSLGGTSVQVTVNGTSLAAPVVSASATQVTAIMPSGVGTGSGNVTVSVNNQSSGGAAINVTSANFGIFTLNGSGGGPAQATDGNGNAITLANPAQPGGNVTLTGTGLGAISADDVSQPSQSDVSSSVTLWVGSEQVTPSYSGRSGQAPGQDQIAFTVPSDAITGCYVPVSVMVNNIVSNFASVAVAPAGSACSDGNGFASAQVQQIQNAGANVRVGSLSLTRVTASDGTVTDSGSALFGAYSASQIASSLGPFQAASAGGCSVFALAGGSAVLTDPVQPQGMNAGASISITNPGGTKANLMHPAAATTGVYSATLPKAFLAAGSFTIDGSDGDVGAITGKVTIPAPATWNTKGISPITLAQGFTVTWTGGDPDSLVTISGASSGALFTCTAPANAGTFTVPPQVTQALPPSDTATLTLLETAPASSFTAPGIDVGVAAGSIGVSLPVTFQ